MLTFLFEYTNWSFDSDFPYNSMIHRISQRMLLGLDLLKRVGVVLLKCKDICLSGSVQLCGKRTARFQVTYRIGSRANGPAYEPVRLGLCLSPRGLSCWASSPAVPILNSLHTRALCCCCCNSLLPLHSCVVLGLCVSTIASSRPSMTGALRCDADGSTDLHKSVHPSHHLSSL